MHALPQPASLNSGSIKSILRPIHIILGGVLGSRDFRIIQISPLAQALTSLGRIPVPLQPHIQHLKRLIW